MKFGLLIILIIFSSSVFACEKTVVTGSVDNFADDMRIDFYCSGSYIGYKNIISKYGTYQKTLSYCSDLEGRLVYADTVIETVSSGGCFPSMDYTGIVQTPMFGIATGVLALGGGILLRKRK